VQSAAKKLRKELAEQIDEQSEVDPEEHIITHDIAEALSELEKQGET
jgi:hypothetical protein